MNSLQDEFESQANRIPSLGLGLSVDVYCPDLFDLMEELSQQRLTVDYLEIFQASPEALGKVRRSLPEMPLAYHAEGIWVTQPNWNTAYGAQDRISSLAQDLGILDALWVNQECATKEMAGRSFGTYLPPIFSEDSARLIAIQSWEIQRWLAKSGQLNPLSGSLFCLEGPPLSYFMAGNLSYAEFFRVITQHTPCGLVLDLGHVWTVYRYSGYWKTQSLMEFFETFLRDFPLERIIQIHLAGLACHPEVQVAPDASLLDSPPFWLDAHEAPIPSVLMEMLVRTLQEPRLVNLKGIALEVDNKAIPLICKEFHQVHEMVVSQRASFWKDPDHTVEKNILEEKSNNEEALISESSLQGLVRSYEHLVELVTGNNQEPNDQLVNWGMEDSDRREGLELYRTQYLPYEILSWGGDLRMMFPRGCHLLDQHKIPLGGFCDFWFSHSRQSDVVYDFFLVKITIFEEFFHQVLPEFFPVVQEESAMLREGYAVACGSEGKAPESLGAAKVEEKRGPIHSSFQQRME